MWIKICGITSLEDAQLAVAAGADAVGFVFARSPRCMTPESAARIIERLPQSIEKVGVFGDVTLDAMTAALEVAGLTGIQLHGEDRIAMVKALRERTKKTYSRLRVIHVLHCAVDAGGMDARADTLRLTNRLRVLREDAAFDTAMDAVLVDTRIADQEGGTGVAFDWNAARPSFQLEASHLRLIAAGGLNPENVQRAIHTLQPWGVDVSSGVEAAPGRKDPKRIEDFLRAAKEAALEPGKVNAGVTR